MVRIKYEKGLDFQIYPNDHLPIHVHVKSGNDEGIFRIEDGEVSFHEDRGLSNRQIRDATEVLEDNVDEFIAEWNRLNR
jgi:Domain of unknown function (DUF4160)